MDNIKKGAIKRFSIYNLKFGVKINVLIFVLVAFSLLVTTIIGYRLFDKYIEQESFQSLERIAGSKKQLVEKEFKDLLHAIPNMFNSELKNNVYDLINAYNQYEFERYDVFTPDSLKKSALKLKEFYKDEVIDEINWNPPIIDEVFPQRDIEIVLQNEFIAENKYLFGNKDRMLSSSDNSSYSNVHLQIQPKLRAICKTNNFNNLYIIDSKNGNIVYNLNKNISFGTNIFNGPYKYAGIVTVYQKALADDKVRTFYADFEHFIPEFNRPIAFLSIPVIRYDEKIAVIIFEITPAFYENILIDSWMYHEHESFKINMIGEDNKVRLNDIRQLHNSDVFFDYMRKKGRRKEIYNEVADLGSSALILQLKDEFNKEEIVTRTTQDYFGDKSMMVSVPINIAGLNYNLIVSRNIKKGFLFRKKLKITFISLFIILVLMGVLTTHFTKESLIGRLKKLIKGMRDLSRGESTSKINNIWHDELGDTIETFEVLEERINSAGKFIIDLSEGDFEKEFHTASENDNFANALNTLRQKLKTNYEDNLKRTEEDRIRNWTNEGVAKFNDLLRQSNNDINNLAYIVIENLVEFLDANQGGVFLVDENENNEKKINIVAAYAYDRRKSLQKTIEIGEGLIGNCYLEKKPIYLKDIPEDYIEITSGLGKSVPSALYISPLIVDSEVLGFIEIASLTDFDKYKIDFINKLSENVAITFSSVRLNTRTSILLEESKRKANEIAQQEEEMRQNLEEMQATQEELARLRSEDEQKTKKLHDDIEEARTMVQQLINNMDGEVLLKDAKGVILLANEEAAARLGFTTDKIIGRTYNDIYSEEKAEKENELDQIVINEGVYTDEITELVGNENVNYFVIKKPFYIESKKETGILTRRTRR